MDSFFEYAFKSHILLSGLGPSNGTSFDDPLHSNTTVSSREEGQDDSEAFLEAWQLAHAAIKHHLLRDLHHPHYVNGHVNTGSPMALWIDSLSAYYPGLLTLAGELEEAISTNLLYTAIWTRFAGLPERWSIVSGGVEGGLGWWPGRPELVESVYYLYRATKDPWYLYVGEMIMKDIQQRCWTSCGWAGLQDVRTGEQADRMESFFLGETIKYLFLLFDTGHPLNSLDAPFVFSTEGHPLIVRKREIWPHEQHRSSLKPVVNAVCPLPPAHEAFTVSVVAARSDIFDAASLSRLSPIAQTDEAAHDHRHVKTETDESISRSPAEYGFFPWTIPWNLIPSNGTCAGLKRMSSFEIQFPTTQSDMVPGQQNVIRVGDNLFITNLGGLKLGLIFEEIPSGEGSELVQNGRFRIHNIGNVLLGRDENVYVYRRLLKELVDPNFAIVQDEAVTDVLVVAEENQVASNENSPASRPLEDSSTTAFPLNLDDTDMQHETSRPGHLLDLPDILGMFLQQFKSSQGTRAATHESKRAEDAHFKLLGVAASGIGACPLPDVPEPAAETEGSSQTTSSPTATTTVATEQEALPWRTIYVTDENCSGKLPNEASTEHQVIVIRRGGCTFSEKLANIPIFRPPSSSSTSTGKKARPLEMVIIVSEGVELIRPLLDEVQHTPAGLIRFHPISMVMVGGGQATMDLFKRAKSVGLRRRYRVSSQGVPIRNVIVV